MTKRDDGRHLIKLADFIECAPSRWLPAAGYVKSFTFTLGEADQVASALRLSAQQREPEPPTSEAIADVSVGELAQFLRDADRQTGNCTDDDTAASYMDLARALLASYRIERLDRLASGRRG